MGRLRFLVAISVLVVITACGGSTSGNVPGPSSTPSGAAGLKPMIHGFIDRNGLPPQGWIGHIAGFVVNVNWSDLQPQPGAPIASDNAIDRAIAQVTALEKQGVNLAIKIRFYAGINAPDWAKQLGGPPVSVLDPTAQRGGTVGRFWTDQFGAAYDSVWAQLAAKYDAVPEIRQIEVARCGTIFTETLVRDTADTQTVKNLLNAGFTFDADQRCLHDEIDQGKAWPHTRIGLELNPYKMINADGSVSNDEAFTEQLMDYCRQSLGIQCVLENNSIRFPPIGGDMGKVYAKMQQLGPPISFQTAIPSRIGSLTDTLSWAQQVGADAVELPNNYPTFAPAQLDPVASGLAANPG